MKCPYCGTENKEDAVECIACQAKLVTPEEVEEEPESNITLTLGNAQAQMQEAPKPVAAPLPVLEKEETPKNLTQQFIEQKEKERENRPLTESKPKPATSSSFDTERIFGALSYLHIIGWIIAYFLTNKNQSRFMKTHLNQGLVINAAILLGNYIPFVGGIIRIAAFVLALIGIYYSATGQDKKLPYIGDIEIFK